MKRKDAAITEAEELMIARGLSADPNHPDWEGDGMIVPAEVDLVPESAGDATATALRRRPPAKP
jgi:flagellar basal body rod protein FlgC